MTIIKLDAIDSTSSYLSALWRQGIFAPPVAVYTSYQTAGRGRRGEQWQSEPHKNLTISFLLDYCSKDPVQSFALIMQTSLVVMQLLEQLKVPDLAIKWPNDIMSGSKKICGILVERALMGSQSSPFVVGVGININQQRFDALSHVTSVTLETNQVQAVDDLARRLTALVEEVMTQSLVLEDQAYTSLLMRFEEFLYQKGNHCEVSINQGSFETVKILGVNEDGRLKIQDKRLNLRLLDSAETQFNYAAKC
jgi:BirA family transcriptional regulator, biotin operon repressor / biotin---[acetyl-CoA-carboxylase] ligase